MAAAVLWGVVWAGTNLRKDVPRIRLVGGQAHPSREVSARLSPDGIDLVGDVGELMTGDGEGRVFVMAQDPGVHGGMRGKMVRAIWQAGRLGRDKSGTGQEGRRMMVFGDVSEAAMRGIKGSLGRGERFLRVNPPEDEAARRLAGELLGRGVEMTIRIGALRGSGSGRSLSGSGRSLSGSGRSLSGSGRSLWASGLIGQRPGAVEELRGTGWFVSPEMAAEIFLGWR